MTGTIKECLIAVYLFTSLVCLIYSLIFDWFAILDSISIKEDLGIKDDRRLKDILFSTSFNPHVVYEKTELNFPTCCIISGLLVFFHVPWIILVLVSMIIAIPICFLGHVRREKD